MNSQQLDRLAFVAAMLVCVIAMVLGLDGMGLLALSTPTVHTLFAVQVGAVLFIFVASE